MPECRCHNIEFKCFFESFFLRCAVSRQIAGGYKHEFGDSSNRGKMVTFTDLRRSKTI